MHSCGILISEEPITNFTALEMPPKGFPIVQFDMHVAEEIGLEKFDILSQRGLGTIDDAVKLIEEKQGIKVNIRGYLGVVIVDLDKDSQQVYKRKEGAIILDISNDTPAAKYGLRCCW